MIREEMEDFNQLDINKKTIKNIKKFIVFLFDSKTEIVNENDEIEIVDGSFLIDKFNIIADSLFDKIERSCPESKKIVDELIFEILMNSREGDILYNKLIDEDNKPFQIFDRDQAEHLDNEKELLFKSKQHKQDRLEKAGIKIPVEDYKHKLIRLIESGLLSRAEYCKILFDKLEKERLRKGNIATKTLFDKLDKEKL